MNGEIWPNQNRAPTFEVFNFLSGTQFLVHVSKKVLKSIWPFIYEKQPLCCRVTPKFAKYFFKKSATTNIRSPNISYLSQNVEDKGEEAGVRETS